MKKRLRKKRCKGEFASWIFSVRWPVQPGSGMESSEAVLDAFIAQAIEANGLACGGGTTALGSELVVRTRSGRGSPSGEQRDGVIRWLAGHSLIEEFDVGSLVPDG